MHFARRFFGISTPLSHFTRLFCENLTPPMHFAMLFIKKLPSKMNGRGGYSHKQVLFYLVFLIGSLLKYQFLQ